MAFGSLRESRAILEMEEIKDPAILRLADDLGAMLYVLSRKLPNPGQTPPLAVIATENKTDSDTDSVSAAPAPKM